MLLLVTVIISLVLIGIPIGFALVLTGVILMLISNIPLAGLPLALFNGANNTILLAVPFFILAGELMGNAGISARLVNFVNSIVGFIRGGLAIANVGANMIFAEISGASIADAVALGKILIPQMEKRGYPRLFSAALTCSAACLGIIIPPSIPMVLMGATVGISIAGLFAAGFVPGILIGVLQAVTAHILVKRRNYPVEPQPFSISAIGKSTVDAIPTLLFPVIILGGIIGGFFTPTEASVVAVVYAAGLGLFIYRELDSKKILNILSVSAKQTAIVMLIVAASYPLGTYFARQHIAQNITEYIISLSNNPTVVLFLITLFLLILGMFFQAAPIIIIVIPLLMPTVKSLQIDPLLFGIVTVIMLSIGQQTPPVATVATAVSSITKLSLTEVAWEARFFMLPMIIVVILTIFFPSIALWLPRLILR